MKVALISLLLITTMGARAQSSDEIFLIIGTSIPVGSYAETNNGFAAASPAKMGGAFGLGYDHLLLDAGLGCTAQLWATQNPINDKALMNSINFGSDEFQLASNGTWYAAALMVGPYYSVKPTDAFEVRLSLLAGIAGTKIAPWSVTSTTSADSTSLISGTGKAYTFSALGLLDFWYLKPPIFKNVPETDSFYAGSPGSYNTLVNSTTSPYNLTQPMNTVGATAGIALHL